MKVAAGSSTLSFAIAAIVERYSARCALPRSSAWILTEAASSSAACLAAWRAAKMCAHSTWNFLRSGSMRT